MRYRGLPPLHSSSRDDRHRALGLRVGFTVISTSYPCGVRNSIRRPTEKLPPRLRISADTCGCLMPRTSPACAGFWPRSPDDLVDLQCQAGFEQLLLRIRRPEIGEDVAAARLRPSSLPVAHVGSGFACGRACPVEDRTRPLTCPYIPRCSSVPGSAGRRP